MYNLIIDTSTDRGFIALAKADSLLEVCHFDTRLQSKQCLYFLDSLLQQTGLSFSAIKTIGVCVGPGSYTGIRVGAAIALGLAATGSPPLVAFSSLEGLICSHEGPFASLIFARLQGAYVMQRQRKGDAIYNLTDAYFLPLVTLQQELHHFAYIVSPAASPSPCTLPLSIQPPDVAYIAKIVESKYSGGDFSHNLNLNYLHQCPSST